MYILYVENETHIKIVIKIVPRKHLGSLIPQQMMPMKGRLLRGHFFFGVTSKPITTRPLIKSSCLLRQLLGVRSIFKGGLQFMDVFLFSLTFRSNPVSLKQPSWLALVSLYSLNSTDTLPCLIFVGDSLLHWPELSEALRLVSKKKTLAVLAILSVGVSSIYFIPFILRSLMRSGSTPISTLFQSFRQTELYCFSYYYAIWSLESIAVLVSEITEMVTS